MPSRNVKAPRGQSKPDVWREAPEDKRDGSLWGAQVAVPPCKGRVLKFIAAHAHDGDTRVTVAAASGDGLVAMLRPKDASSTSKWQIMNQRSMSGIAGIPAYSFSGDALVAPRTSGGYGVWSPKTSEESASFAVHGSRFSAATDGASKGFAAMMPDDKTVVGVPHDCGFPSAFDADGVQLFGCDTAAGSSHVGSVESFAASPAMTEGKSVFATGGADGAIKMWHVTDGESLTHFASNESKHSSAVTAMVISPDGSLLLSGCDDDSTLVLWEVETFKELYQLRRVNDGPLAGLTYSPNRYWACAVMGIKGGAVEIWDLERKDVVECSTGVVPMSATPTAHCWSADGATLLIACDDGGVYGMRVREE